MNGAVVNMTYIVLNDDQIVKISYLDILYRILVAIGCGGT